MVLEAVFKGVLRAGDGVDEAVGEAWVALLVVAGVAGVAGGLGNTF